MDEPLARLGDSSGAMSLRTLKSLVAAGSARAVSISLLWKGTEEGAAVAADMLRDPERSIEESDMVVDKS